MAGRRDPFGDIDELFERLNRQFSELSQAFEGEIGAGVDVDLADRGDELVVTADLPGFDRDDIDLRLEDDRLHIRAEYSADETAEDARYHVRERRHRSVSRAIPLPSPVRADETNAEHNNGVLTVTLPKVEPSDSAGHRIDVE